MDAPALEAFKARLGEALSNLIQRVASLPAAGGWHETTRESLQPEPFYDSKIRQLQLENTTVLFTLQVLSPEHQDNTQQFTPDQPPAPYKPNRRLPGRQLGEP